MALAFASSSTDHVNHGKASAINDLPGGANGCTFVAWVYRTADDGNQHIFTMDGVDFASRGGLVFLASSGAADNLRALVRAATTDTDYTTNTGALPLNTWTFVAVTFKDTDSPKLHIYSGSLTALATEASYASSTDGSGAVVADNANDKWISNIERANTLPLVGNIARAAYFNTKLSLTDLQRLQFAPVAQWSGANTKLLVDYHGTGTQRDYTGNGNAGTVTGATVAAHVPLGPAWGRRLIHAVEFADVASGYGMLIGGGSVIPGIFSRVRVQ